MEAEEARVRRGGIRKPRNGARVRRDRQEVTKKKRNKIKISTPEKKEMHARYEFLKYKHKQPKINSIRRCQTLLIAAFYRCFISEKNLLFLFSFHQLV